MDDEDEDDKNEDDDHEDDKDRFYFLPKPQSLSQLENCHGKGAGTVTGKL